MAALSGKTKAELLEIIREKERELVSLNEELRSLEKCKRYNDIADELKDVIDKFCDNDFTRDEAFELLCELIRVGQIPAPIRRVGYVNYRNM